MNNNNNSYLALASFLSTEKAYSSSPRLNNLELILFVKGLLLQGLNPGPSLYNISAKNELNFLQNHVFEILFLSSFLSCFSEFSPPIFVLAVFLISGYYLTINNDVFVRHLTTRTFRQLCARETSGYNHWIKAWMCVARPMGGGGYSLLYAM